MMILMLRLILMILLPTQMLKNVYKAKTRKRTNVRKGLCSDTELSCAATKLETDCETQHSFNIFKEVYRVIK